MTDTDFTDKKTKLLDLKNKLNECEQRFRTIADYSYDWENWIGPGGRLIWVNPAVTRITGYSVEECMAMPDFPMPIIEETHRDRLTELFKAAVNGSSGNDVEFQIACKDESKKWASVSWQPVYDDNGVFLGHRSSIRDIGKRKQAEESLGRSEQDFHNIFNNAPIGIYQVSLEGRFISANPAAGRILGYESPGELINSITDINTQIYAFPEDRDKAISLLRENGFIRNFEVRCRHKDGSIVWVLFNARLVRDKHGNILYHEGTSQDITERKNIVEELIRHRDHLGELVKERTKELERNITQVKKTQNMLSGILDSTSDFMIILDEGYNIIWMNKTSKKFLGNNAYGKKCYEVIHRRDTACDTCAVEKTFKDGHVHEYEIKIVHAGVNTHYFWCTSASASYHKDGRTNTVLETLRDITPRKLTEETLREREEKLALKSRNLEEMNIALKVLLEQREKDKNELEEKFVSNTKRLITPYLNKLKGTSLNDTQKTYLSIMENNINDIISPFLNKMNVYNFTPKELEVALYIREGKGTKEIAKLMNVCKSSIDLHRYNIRTKLGLNNKKTNLRTYLTYIS